MKLVMKMINFSNQSTPRIIPMLYHVATIIIQIKGMKNKIPKLVIGALS